MRKKVECPAVQYSCWVKLKVGLCTEIEESSCSSHQCMIVLHYIFARALSLWMEREYSAAACGWNLALLCSWLQKEQKIPENRGIKYSVTSRVFFPHFLFSACECEEISERSTHSSHVEAYLISLLAKAEQKLECPVCKMKMVLNEWVVVLLHSHIGPEAVRRPPL